MKRETAIENFGKRLAALRKQRGLTQKELANRIGVSRRVIVYYEVESDYPATHLVVPLAKALNVSVDELLGVKDIAETRNPQLAALWRKLKVLETFSEKDRKAVLHYINMIAEKNKAERKAKTAKTKSSSTSSHP